jgi:hypothetical protein
MDRVCERLAVCVFLQIPLRCHCYMSEPQVAKSCLLQFIFRYLCGTIVIFWSTVCTKMQFASVYVHLLCGTIVMSRPQFVKIFSLL